MVDLPMLVFLSILASVAVSYLVLGLTGFGSALVAVPLLLLFMPLGQAVPVVLLLDVLAFTVFGALNRAHIDWQVWRRMLPSMALGVVCAAISLAVGWLPQAWLLLLLGLYIATFAGMKLQLEFMPTTLQASSPPLANPQLLRFWPLFPYGWAAGVVETWFGTCGPIVVAGVLKQTNSVERFKATTSALILPASCMALLSYALSYTLTDYANISGKVSLLFSAMWLAPIAIVSVWLGHRWSKHLSQRAMRGAVYGLLMVSGLMLILKALQGL